MGQQFSLTENDGGQVKTQKSNYKSQTSDTKLKSQKLTMKRAHPKTTPFLVTILLLILTAQVVFGQPAQNLLPVFETAAQEFNVPVAILKGIAFVETRWSHIRSDEREGAERHMPPAYGVMGLRDDDWFGHSLQEAAKLIHSTPEALKEDVELNIRAGAALLADIASQQAAKPDNARLESWLDVVARFSGIPQKDIQGKYGREVFRVLHDGYNDFGIAIEPEVVDLGAIDRRIERDYPTSPRMSLLSEDYGPAVWYASPNFNSRSGTPITHVIIHDTEGNFAGALSWLTNPASQVSAHYLFRSSDGYLAQMVREADRAWHVGCWNSWTIGIEHEGFVNQPQYYTPVMYQQSALLVRHLCNRYGIAPHRIKIVGHFVWQDPVIFPQLGWASCNDHTDPGPFWNWNYFMSLIVADSTSPAVVSHYPAANQQNVPIYKNISITFDRPMELFSTQGGFSVFPSVAGSFRWSDDGKTLTFDPTNFLPNSESFAVSVAATAKGSGGGELQQPLQFVFTTAPLDTAGPQIVASYPREGSTDASQYVGFQIRWDEPVVFSSFGGRVRLVDAADSTVALGFASVVYTDIDDRGFLTFFPSAAMQLGHTYRLSFLPGLRDILGNLSASEQRVTFTVQTSPFAQGTVIDPMENNSAQWQQPEVSPETIGIDTALTSFAISSTYKKSGSYSGKIAYTFSDTAGGVCRILNFSQPSTTVANGWFGAWVLGDNSKNQLEYWFTMLDGTDAIAPLGTIDWFGWRFVSVPLALLGNNVAAFNSIVVRQVSGADRSGTLYIDDLQLETVTGVAERGRGAYQTFALYQNYPNPFNPSTTIFFELEREEKTILSVYNTLGQQVAVLLNKPLEAGRHGIQFLGQSADGKPLPSGVYLYRLQTSSGSQVRKMVLMK